MKRKLYLSLFLSVLFISSIGSTTFANGQNPSEEEKTLADNGFSVRIKDSDRQLGDKLPYFHYNVKPGETYTNVYILENQTTEEKVIDAKIVNAFTNPFASFNFSSDNETDLSVFLDEKRKLTSILKPIDPVTLKPNSVLEVPLTLSIPEELESGQLIGAVIFEEQNQSTETATEGSTVLTSKINYVISTFLEFEKPEMIKIEFGDVRFNNTYAIPRIEAEILNLNATLLKESQLSYVVKEKDGEKLFDGKVKISRFGPSTNVLAPINWEHTTLKEGDYTIELSFSSISGEFETVKETKNFTITPEMLHKHQAEFGEDPILPRVDIGSPLFYISLILALLVGILGGYWYIKRKEKALILKYTEKDTQKSIYGPQEKPKE